MNRGNENNKTFNLAPGAVVDLHLKGGKKSAKSKKIAIKTAILSLEPSKKKHSVKVCLLRKGKKFKLNKLELAVLADALNRQIQEWSS